MIGEGAFGRVYEGRDRRLEREVAVKVIKPWWGDDPEWMRAFEREARLLASVSDPGIVQIYDAGHAPEGLYYVSELVRGEDLAKRLRRGPLHPAGARAIAERLCRALAHAHSRGIVHRDVKPANVMLSDGGQVKLGDLGIARLTSATTGGDPGLTRATSGHVDGQAAIAGTPRYMAPEQSRGLPATPATDVYSAGVVLYEMLAGSPPFAGGSVVELALRHERDPPPPLPAGIETSLARVTMRALAKNPARRYADGGEMAAALAATRSPGRTGGVRAGTGRPRRAAAAATGVTRVAAGAGTTAVTRRLGGAERAAIPVRRSDHGHPPPARTRVAAAPSRPPEPQQHVAPSRHGRSRVTGLALAFLAVIAATVAAVVATMPGGAVARTRVPRLTRLDQARATAVVRRAHVRVSFSRRYDSAPAGTVISQRPRAGMRVDRGARVRAVLSRGPAPVRLPSFAGQTAADAERTLHSLQLQPRLRYVPAPGTAPGVVTGQRPAGSGLAAVGTTVSLSVAETPAWRAVTTFTGDDSGPLKIRGTRWRVVYRMGFQGTCTWLFFCDGPTASLSDASSGRTVSGFGLTDGTAQSQVFDTGPGTYRLRITPGGDSAAWSVTVQDWY